MKKLFLTLTIATLAVFSSCKENATEKINQENVTKAAERDSQAIDFPSISFDKTEHDFGEIMNGTPVETTFAYTNTGKSPLVVTDSCLVGWRVGWLIGGGCRCDCGVRVSVMVLGVVVAVVVVGAGGAGEVAVAWVAL